MVNFERKETYSLQDLIEILRILRAPGGCPWDRAQTHLSDRRNFLEEAYEAAEAFDRDDPALMCEELGDMLMQVLFNIHIEEDAGRFTTDDVTDHICKKLIFRHPHVFGTAAADTSEEVLVNWEALKRQEKGQQTTADAMDAVARSLPALWRADKLQSKAAKAGFEFAGVSGALDKLDEETRELREAVERGTNFSEELGDVLFAAVKAGRFLNVDPEDALNATCEKFIARFRRVEEACAARGAGLLHAAEAGDEFLAGGVQRVLGVDVQKAAGLDGGKEHVAKLLGEVRAALDGLAQLARFLVELVQRAGDTGKFKAGLGGLALELVRAPEGGQRAGDGVHRVGGGLLALFLPLERLPVHEDLLAGVSGSGSENMGVAEDELFADVIGHIVGGEAARILLNVDVEEDLHEHIAQLLAHEGGIVAVERLGGLVGLL